MTRFTMNVIVIAIPIYLFYLFIKFTVKRAIKESSDELKKMMREVANETIEQYEWNKHNEEKKSESEKA
ncbi:hypothetical protein [Clostridium tunisiense]|uniref:hypothetical protein n=1 Tax=Clostridium tunisiense TaxID=219748 RepID=UPI0003049973|nr:hypothetical protein [Clostridium tunisiense]